MATDTKRILHIQTADFTDLNNTQIGVMNVNDADLGYRMWGGKDINGKITRWLAKDQDAQVLDMYLKDADHSGTNLARLIHSGDPDNYHEFQNDYQVFHVGGVDAIEIFEGTGSPPINYINIGMDIRMNGFELQADTGNDFIIELGDASGANKLSIQDSADAEIFKMDSNGALYVSQFIYHLGDNPDADGAPTDPDTYIEMQENYIRFFAGNTEFIRIVEDAAISPSGSYIEFNPIDSPTNHTSFIFNTIVEDHLVLDSDLQQSTFNTVVMVKDKLCFTQDDRNEFIDSLNDGYMDYGATTGHRFNNKVAIGTVAADHMLHISSDGDDARITIERTGVNSAKYDIQVANDEFKIVDASGADVTRFQIGATGNVGIGVDAEGKFHVRTADSGATADADHDDGIFENDTNAGIVVLGGSGAGNKASIALGATGDPDYLDLYASFDDNEAFLLQAGVNVFHFEEGSNGLTVNEDGADRNFRVESNGNADMLNIDGELDLFGIGKTPVVAFGILQLNMPTDDLGFLDANITETLSTPNGYLTVVVGTTTRYIQCYQSVDA